jgi:ABC-type Fe3+ transport system permease subunit
MTARTALTQLDPDFEPVAASLKVPLWLTLWRVTVPACLPAILEIARYFFVSAMTTVSAVIFLYPGHRTAAVAVLNMDDADTAAAAAMATLIGQCRRGLPAVCPAVPCLAAAAPALAPTGNTLIPSPGLARFI